MRIRRLTPVVLVLAGLGIVLWAGIAGPWPSTRRSVRPHRDAGEAPEPLRQAWLRGTAEREAPTARPPKAGTDRETVRSGRTAEQTRRGRERSSLDVRVVSGAGRPRPDVLLLAVVVGDGWVHSAEVRPDEDGWARIHLPARREADVATLILDAPGFAWVTLRGLRLGTQAVRYHGDVLLEPGRTIRGRVVDERGAGVGHATVRVYPAGVPPGRIGFRYPKPREAETGKDGTFELRHAPLGPSVLRVEHVMHVARPQDVPDPAGPITLTAHRAGHIWGTIGQKGGGGARVMLRAEPLDPTWAEPHVDGSDSYGRIRMGPLLPGRYRVVVDMGWEPGEPAGPGSPALPSTPIPDVELGTVTVEAGAYASVRWTLP